MRVFVNYRTGDGESVALLVSRYLSDRIGEGSVFYASRSIPAGAMFDHELLRNVWRSDILVAVIGPRWLSAGSDGDRALHKPDDWVRREIIEALEHKVTVIPLLFNNASLPRVGQLPKRLARMARCQYVRLDFRAPDSGLEQLAVAVGAGDGPPNRHKNEGESGGGGQLGGIGSISATTVTAVTDARGPVYIGEQSDDRKRRDHP